MATVTRVLPWRRAANRPPSAEIAGLLAEFTRHHPKASTEQIEKAFAIADEAHRGQNRKSGEPYIRHPVAVATIVARQGLADTSVAAALLHDAALKSASPSDTTSVNDEKLGALSRQQCPWGPCAPPSL